MDDKNTNRLTRLTSILIQLQTQRIVTSTQLSKKFNVSIRTIYRDIKALEQAGVPVLTEEGKGYTLMDGYNIPPVMFTESEANALILTEQLVLKNKDDSLVREYSKAISKIKAVLRSDVKDKANLLADRTNNSLNLDRERTSNNLTNLQIALTNFLLVDIIYTDEAGAVTQRVIQPFALLSTENWLLIAWCTVKEDFRFFRLDRIAEMAILDEHFRPHKMSLQEYFDHYHNS